MESGLENSFAREHYSTAIEKGINEQINTVGLQPLTLCCVDDVDGDVDRQPSCMVSVGGRHALHWTRLWAKHTPCVAGKCSQRHISSAHDLRLFLTLNCVCAALQPDVRLLRNGQLLCA